MEDKFFMVALMIIGLWIGDCKADLCSGGTIFGSVACEKILSRGDLLARLHDERFKPKAKEVGRLLAMTSDKDAVVYGEFKVGELLEVAEIDDKNLKSCRGSVFRKHRGVCKELSANKLLSDYCLYYLERRSQFCARHKEQLFDFFYRNTESLSKLLNYSNRISACIVEELEQAFDGKEEEIVKYLLANDRPNSGIDENDGDGDKTTNSKGGPDEPMKSEVIEKLCIEVARDLGNYLANFMKSVDTRVDYSTLERIDRKHALVWKRCKIIKDINASKRRNEQRAPTMQIEHHVRDN